mgnify:CR=1 FL=1
MPNAPLAPDPNRRLAQRIGNALDRGDAIDAVLPDDDLGRAVRAYRQQARGPAPSEAASARMWAAIEAEMDAPASAAQDPSAPNAPAADRTPDAVLTRIVRIGTARRWAVAAALLVAVGLAWMWLQAPAGPNVVARATATMVTYTAPDGSTVRLRPHSTLTRLDDTDALRFRLDGEAVFAVEPRPEGSPFVVDAGDGRVRVLGTCFLVRTWTPQPEVFLSEGRVAWSHTRSGQSVVLDPGQQGTLTDAGSVTARAADPSRPLAWLERELVLEQRPVRSVVAELEQHFAITVQVPDSVVAQTVSGRILLDDAASSLQDLGVVLGGRFEALDDRTYRFVPR